MERHTANALDRRCTSSRGDGPSSRPPAVERRTEPDVAADDSQAGPPVGHGPAVTGSAGRDSARLTAAVRALGRLRPADDMGVAQQRRLLADLFRLLGDHLKSGSPARPDDAPQPAGTSAPARAAPEPSARLSPRARQTLNRPLLGDSEKQLARNMGLSRHTVHVYVKTLYRRFDVCSRCEMLARFVGPAGGGPADGGPAANGPASRGRPPAPSRGKP